MINTQADIHMHIYNSDEHDLKLLILHNNGKRILTTCAHCCRREQPMVGSTTLRVGDHKLRKLVKHEPKKASRQCSFMMSASRSCFSFCPNFLSNRLPLPPERMQTKENISSCDVLVMLFVVRTGCTKMPRNMATLTFPFQTPGL